MDPPDMSEIAPDPTILDLDLTEAPPRLGGASDRGTTEAGRHRGSVEPRTEKRHRTEPRGLVVLLQVRRR